ncbi:MAG TPA: cobalamin-independent methionine synthase II family protein [Chthoniobacterales bacterium]|jgi:5-methyltetrahydropteroyltriglutamate--homocysteine methyltransferase|nr:cobalamin-independent methionine synthase II family protein [Chthoniobacterales bacterium]
MTIPTEPIGSIPRPQKLISAFARYDQGSLSQEDFESICLEAVRDTIQKFEATGSPVITDGEQTKPSFATYPIHNLSNLSPGGVKIQFADGHVRQLPKLLAGPFRYKTYASTYLRTAKEIAQAQVKQAVISPSALSLLYPSVGIADYPKEMFLDDLVNEAARDIRDCLKLDAHCVQIDFTEGRLAVKLDPSGQLLLSFITLINRVLEQFSGQERKRVGVHTCPGGDRDSTHSADVDYAGLLPSLLRLDVGNFYMQLASEPDRRRVLRIVRENLPPSRRVFVGVIDPINPRVETPQEVRDRVFEASEFIPPEFLGTTDDCGFSPFGDDVSTAREIAFAKVRSRVEGTLLAAEQLE